jgi:hypothetical protein
VTKKYSAGTPTVFNDDQNRIPDIKDYPHTVQALFKNIARRNFESTSRDSAHG